MPIRRARALTGTALSAALSGSRARPFSYAPAGLTRLWPLAPRVSLRFTLGYDPAAASRLKRYGSRLTADGTKGLFVPTGMGCH